MKRNLLFLILCLNLAACGGAPEKESAPGSTVPSEHIEAAIDAVPPKDSGVPALSEKEAFIQRMMDTMTLEEMAGQMLFLSFETSESGGALTEIDGATIAALEKHKPGGVIYFGANIDTAAQTLKLSKDLQSNSRIPLFIGTDEEGGKVSRITRSGKIDAVKIPPAKEIGNTSDTSKAYEAALTISRELTALGINVDFAPCADLNSDNEGVIGDRAFSGKPETASEFVTAAVAGFIDGGIICSLKHFPGHGTAPGDTHEAEIISEKSLAEILKADMLPFVSGIQADAPMVMFSHITVPEWGVPSSLSSDAVKYLRDELGFDSVIITDAMRMGAVTECYSPSEAAIMAVNAGIDILLLPESAEDAFNALVSAVTSGKTDIGRLEESVYRILSLKYDYGLLN